MKQQIDELQKDLCNIPSICNVETYTDCKAKDGSCPKCRNIARDLYDRRYRKQSEGCDYCKQGDEKCGTCVEFFKGMDGCAAECDNEKCIAYKPVHYCHNCGARMKGGE